MGAAVEHRAAVGTDDVRETGRLSTSLRRRHRRFLVAKSAFDRRSDVASPTFGIEYPRAELERRLVAHMPLMPAGELGYPGASRVLVETNDCPLHFSTIRPRRG